MEAIQSPTRRQQLAALLSRWQEQAANPDPEDQDGSDLLIELLNDLEWGGFSVSDWAERLAESGEPFRPAQAIQEAHAALADVAKGLSDLARKVQCIPQEQEDMHWQFLECAVTVRDLLRLANDAMERHGLGSHLAISYANAMREVR